MAIEKSVLSIVAYGLLSHLRYLYRFYHSRAPRAWSFCNEMYHNVFRYEYLTFQTQIYLHKQYIFDTNIIQSEYALLFPFSILNLNLFMPIYHFWYLYYCFLLRVLLNKFIIIKLYFSTRWKLIPFCFTDNLNDVVQGFISFTWRWPRPKREKSIKLQIYLRFHSLWN